MQREQRQYQCVERVAGGKKCGVTFKRQWNLKRHLQKQHSKVTEPVYGNHHARGKDVLMQIVQQPRRSMVSPATRLPGIESILSLAGSQTEQSMLSSATRLPGIASMSSFAGPGPQKDATIDITSTPTSAKHLTMVSLCASGHAAYPARQTTPTPPTSIATPDRPLAGQDVGRDKIRTSQHRHDSDVDQEAEVDEDVHAKQRWSLRARHREDMPAYDVKLSKTYKTQQKGVQWLTQDGKDAFDSWSASLITPWGVSPSASRSSICVICPRDWASLQPNVIASMLNCLNSPLVDSNRLGYKFSDHLTTAARAAAWFGQWPRRGIELDNFMECGPFKHLDGSHLCHNPLCIMPSHVVLEPTSINEDRYDCFKRARFLRSHHKAIPAECGKHDPPCMMQHAALTTFERCLIQAWALRQQQGITSSNPQRPRTHQFESLEYQLPLTFSPNSQAICLEPADMAIWTKQAYKPTLLCGLCTRIKGFAGVAALWCHIVHKHRDRSDEDRLGEVRRTADLWRQYLERESSINGQRRQDTTSKRLAEVQTAAFTWADVVAWNLR